MYKYDGIFVPYNPEPEPSSKTEIVWAQRDEYDRLVDAKLSAEGSDETADAI